MLQNLFISEVRIRILKLLLLNPEESYHVRAIVRAVEAEINAVRRELENLTGMNLLRRRQSSNRIYYTVDTSHIFYSELIGLLAKEDGLGEKIIKNAKDLGDVRFAMLAKPFLRGRESSPLDVDLFLVGNINLSVLENLIKEYQAEIGREMNYSTMSEEEFKHRKRSHDQFVTKVLTQSRTMLIGDEEKFVSVV